MRVTSERWVVPPGPETCWYRSMATLLPGATLYVCHRIAWEALTSQSV